MNKNIKKIVYKILNEEELAREDTLYLIQQTIMIMLDCNYGTAFGQVIQGMRYKGISFEAITRAKRKFFEENPKLVSKKTKEVREKEEKNYYLEYKRKL